MLVSLPIIVVFLMAVGLPPTRMSRKFITIHWWDYALPAIGLPIWVILTIAEIGETASLSNLVVEGFWVLIASAVTPWARYFLLRVKHRCMPVIFHFMYIVPAITAVLLRLNMPTLPE